MPMTYPTIDAHFWVERDGIIIDPYFKEYNYIKTIRGLGDEQVHLEADLPIQNIMIEIHKRVLKSVMGGADFQEAMKNFVDFAKKFQMDTPTADRCWNNVLLEVYKNGGEIKFGSMGWKYKNSNKIFYEYGGVDWKVKDFMK
jgi:hypothetical protein